MQLVAAREIWTFFFLRTNPVLPDLPFAFCLSCLVIWMSLIWSPDKRWTYVGADSKPAHTTDRPTGALARLSVPQVRPYESRLCSLWAFWDENWSKGRFFFSFPLLWSHRAVTRSVRVPWGRKCQSLMDDQQRSLSSSPALFLVVYSFHAPAFPSPLLKCVCVY